MDSVSHGYGEHVKYRWLDTDKPVIFCGRKTGIPERYGQEVKVLIVGRGPGPRNTMVEFDDGYRVVVPFGCLLNRKE